MSMRVTLELDDDLVAAAKRLARQQGSTLGEVITALARRSLGAEAPLTVRKGVPPLVPKASATKPDLETVNTLREGA